MRPVIMTAGKRPIYDPHQNRITIQFFFPKEDRPGGDHGEIDFINGDMPRIIVKVGPEVQVELDRLEIKEKEEQRRMKKS